MSKDDLSDFAATTAKSGSSGKGSGLLVHGFAWCSVVVFLAFGVPRAEAAFQDFGVDLPSATKLVIKVSHLRFALLPVVPAILVTDGLILSALSRSGDVWASRVWSFAMLALPILILALVLAAFAMPMITIMSPHKLSG